MEPLLEVFRCPPDHQAAEEDREQGHHHRAVEPAARTAGGHFAKHHVQHQHRSADAGVAVIRRVCAAVGAGGRGPTEDGAAGHAKAGLGAFGRRSDGVDHSAVRHQIRRDDCRGANHE